MIRFYHVSQSTNKRSWVHQYYARHSAIDRLFAHKKQAVKDSLDLA